MIAGEHILVRKRTSTDQVHMPIQAKAHSLDTAEGDVSILVRLFTQIADRWRLSVEERCILLGGIARSTHYEWTHERPPRTLLLDQRHRIGHVLGIDVATQAFYGLASANAASHITRPHTAPNGEGTALSVMLTGLPGLAAVRQHMEALCGGSPVGAALLSAQSSGQAPISRSA